MKKTGTAKLGGKTIKFKEGALHKQLKVPENKTIGVSNLKKIQRAKIGSTVRIPTSTRTNKDFKVTELMKKRAVFGLNISGSGEKKGDKSKTRKGDKDYTKKRGDKDYHEGGKDVRKRNKPY